MTKKIKSNTLELSIIMAVFNESENVSMAIESIINQSHKIWNLIIIDDGSTDDTKKIVQSYVDKHNNIQLLINKTNCGLAYSLNKAISNSNSEYIARMDADDVSLPHRLEKQMEFLQLHSEVDVLGTGSYITTSDSKVKTVVFKPETHKEIFQSIEKKNPFFHSSVVMKKSFLDALGVYDEKCLRAQDYDLWLRGVDTAIYHNLPEPLMLYSSRNQSIKSLIYGFGVRVVNAVRRRRIMTGILMAVMAVTYGFAVKAKRFIMQR